MPNKLTTTTARILRFLDPVDNPSAGKTAKVRKEVRSHATTQWHYRKREEERIAWEAEYEAQSHLDQSLVPSITKQDEEAELQHFPEEVEQDLPNNLPEHFIKSTSIDLFNPLIAPFRDGSLAFQLFVLNDPSHKVGSICNALGTDAITVLTTHRETLLNEADTWEHEYQPLTRPGTARTYLPQTIFQDPALVNSWLLHGLSQKYPSNIIPILRLRGHVIRTINEALDDPMRAISDDVIIAVVLLASTEATHGLRESYLLHIRGLMELINRRGGLRELGYGGCIEAYILRLDSQFTRLVGGKGYIHLANNPSPIWKAENERNGYVVEADEILE